MGAWVETKDKSMTFKRETTFLGPDAVHIHLLRIKEIFPGLLAFLSEEDQARIRGFSLEARRQEYLWSRLLIRELAGFYLKKDPDNLRFGLRKGGKPILEGSRLRFNLSHTQELIACSFSWHEVGIDIEKIDLSLGALQRGRRLAERYFSGQEKDFLRAQPLETQGLAYFQIFTMKEAYVKASGHGLRLPFNLFSIPLIFGRSCQSGRWSWLSQIVGSAQYSLAQVTDNPRRRPLEHKIYEWDEPFRKNLLEGKRAYSRLSALSGTVS
jgi:phosphopantetheinyl transferase